MSQTVDAYQEALEREIKRWNEYERVLRGDNKKFFGELMNMTRGYVSEEVAPKKTWFFNRW
jgi:hypothetical protein